MPCPTCSHAMNGLGQNDRGDNIFHCPRCGTAKIDAFGLHGDKVAVPEVSKAAPLPADDDPSRRTAGFAFGYGVCQYIFFGASTNPVAAAYSSVPDGFDPSTTRNPFPVGTDEQKGFSQAFYDFTQK